MLHLAGISFGGSQKKLFLAELMLVGVGGFPTNPSNPQKLVTTKTSFLKVLTN